MIVVVGLGIAAGLWVLAVMGKMAADSGTSPAVDTGETDVPDEAQNPDQGIDPNAGTGKPSADDVESAIEDFLVKQEGFSAKAYNDPPGSATWSIGYGHQIRLGESYDRNSVIAEPEGRALLHIDIVAAYTCVCDHVQVGLTLNQAAALTSFVFNEGCAHFASSTMLGKLNAGDYAGASEEFPKWVYETSGGVKIKNPDLVARRDSEQGIFLS